MRKVASRGNLTLPRDLREAMSIAEGDIIEFEVVGIVLKHNTDAEPHPLSMADRPHGHPAGRTE